jgi:hypothetical protein
MFVAFLLPDSMLRVFSLLAFNFAADENAQVCRFVPYGWPAR